MRPDDLLKLTFGFDRDGAETVARELGGYVTCDTYGPNRELREWAALVPCEWTGPATDRALAAAREHVPAAALAIGRVRIPTTDLPEFNYRPEA